MSSREQQAVIRLGRYQIRVLRAGLRAIVEDDLDMLIGRTLDEGDGSEDPTEVAIGVAQAVMCARAMAADFDKILDLMAAPEA